MTELHRWNDDRLDDLAERVRLNADTREQLVQLRADIAAVAEDAQQCIQELRAFKHQQEERERLQHEERKSDRKWMIGTALAVAMLIVAALGIFLG